jgi:alpha-L-arabinofuranosidase
VDADQGTGGVSPLLHSRFAEHFGSCIHGGLHAGEDSHIPNIPCYCKIAIEFPQTREALTLRWPRG